MGRALSFFALRVRGIGIRGLGFVLSIRCEAAVLESLGFICLGLSAWVVLQIWPKGLGQLLAFHFQVWSCARVCNMSVGAWEG